MRFSRSDSRLTIPTRCFSSSSSGTIRPSSFTAPAMAVSGWRISCAMAAESRPSAAMRSLVATSCSSRFNSVRSWKLMTYPVVSLSPVRSGETEMPRNRGWPSGGMKFDLSALRQQTFLARPVLRQNRRHQSAELRSAHLRQSDSR